MHVSVRFHHSPIKTVAGVRKNVNKSAKNANDLCDLDFDPVTFRLTHDLDLD